MTELSDILIHAVYEMVYSVHRRAVECGMTDRYVVVSRDLLPEMTWHTVFGDVEFVQDKLAALNEVYAMTRTSYEEMMRQRV